MIRKLLYGTAIVLALSSPAFAGTRCTLTEKDGTVITYTFNRSDIATATWWEAAFTKNGSAYPTTDPIWKTRWQGRYFIVSPQATPEFALAIGPYSTRDTYGSVPVVLLRGRNQVAWGDCIQYDGPAYDEPVYSPPPPPVYSPPPPASPPAPSYAPPSPGGRDSVGLAYDQGAIYVQVGLGSGSLRMQLDTGASFSTVPEDVADRLKGMGEAHLVGMATVTMADGHTRDEEVILIDRVVIGSHVIGNVKAGVTPVGSTPLLGLDVLSFIGKFQIDPAAGQLVFG
jgi:clan AA aspartic protease (TIGR02281 family)